LFGDEAKTVGVEQRLELARAYVREHGGVAMTEVIARAVPEPEERAAILLIVSAFASLGAGVGSKEGMALHALARAFGVPLADLQKMLTTGKERLSERPPPAT